MKLLANFCNFKLFFFFNNQSTVITLTLFCKTQNTVQKLVRPVDIQ